MVWLYENTQIETLPEDCVGFVYLITNNVTGRKYIGKKLAKFSKTTYRVVKLKNGNKKRKKIKSKIDSDWQLYYGSNIELNKDLEELGRELDFDNLSRGERNRLILSMSWAFRDVFESLYQPINLLFIDEMIDNGLDTSGVENALALLKQMSRERHKSIWLVSHRDELAGRVENILKVVKENGFTSYNTDVEIA